MAKETTKEVIQLMGIKTNGGVYVSQVMDKVYANAGMQNSPINSLWLINGKSPVTSWHKDWNLVDDIPTEIKENVKIPNDNYRYELIDSETGKKLGIPQIYRREDVAVFDDHEYQWFWREDFKMQESLYKLVWDEHADEYQDVEFEYTTAYECDSLEDSGFEYSVRKSVWKSEGTTLLKPSDIQNQILDKILFPDIVLPKKPCKLTTQQTYDIIRQYVLDNIDGRVSRVTSDYDFCFSVEKVVPLSETYTFTSDANLWKRTKRVKMVQHHQNDRRVKIFEMAPKAYQKYPVVTAFSAKSHKALKEKIDNYCEALITFINTPVTDCSTCKGMGVVLNKFEGETK
ncbi:MAG: hypothetical protein KUG81_07350 [Gammaproteobacteria bacterium]|nr:hypothetical protein [Gammaproteobacteria bacterium]